MSKNQSITNLQKTFKENKNATIIATIFGLADLSTRKRDVFLTGSRLITAGFQDRFLEQLAQEISGLAENGGLKDNLKNNNDIMSIHNILFKEIDDNPDQIDRLNAIRSLFILSIKKRISNSQTLMLHQLAQKAKKLTSMDLIVLKTCYYKVYKDSNPKYHSITYSTEWLNIIVELNKGGGDFRILASESEKNLVSLGLLNDALGVSKETIHPGKNFRLSDLGISLCNYLDDYKQEPSK